MKLIDVVKEGVLDIPTLSIEDLATRHGVPVEDIKKQVTKGIEHELEHTSTRRIAKEIALDHIKEDPVYYDKLDKTFKE